jgi:hypothetical protein
MNRSAFNAIAINGSIYARLAAEAGIEFNSTLELIYGNTAAGDAYLEMTAEADPAMIVQGTADAGIVVSGQSQPHVLRMFPESLSSVEIGAEIAPFVRRMADGDAELVFQSEVAESVSLSVPGQGDAAILFDWKIDGAVGRSVFMDGIASVKITAQAERYGRPAITSEYMPAHRSWQIQIPREEVTFTVPREDWGSR